MRSILPAKDAASRREFGNEFLRPRSGLSLILSGSAARSILPFMCFINRASPKTARTSASGC